jgi:hypothetical protein
MKFPFVEFPADHAKTLAGRSHLPNMYRDLIKAFSGLDTCKIILEIAQSDSGLVFRLVIREDDNTIRDVLEVTPDLKKVRRFFEMNGIIPSLLESDVQLLMGWTIQLQ